MILIEGNREALYQWDLNQRIVLTGVEPGTEIHFSDSHDTEEVCPVLEAYEENSQIYADIPNIFLQKKCIIYVYIYVKELNKSFTKHYAEIIVMSRKKPADYVYTETEVKRWETLEEEVRKAIEQTGYYIPSVDNEGNISWTPSKSTLPLVDNVVNIKGPKGDKGDDYIMTEGDKDEIAGKVSVEVKERIEYLNGRANEHDERLNSQSGDIEALAQSIEAPKNVIYLENDLRIEAREDGIYLCGSDTEHGVEDETLLYSPYSGVKAAEAGHANYADEAGSAVDANYSYCAEVDSEERVLKGTLVDEFGDVENAVPAIADGYIRAYGIVSTSLIATIEEGYQRIDFESELYFATPSEIPENYTQFPADIYFKGDSTDEGAFVPEANMRYTIAFGFDGYMMNAYVSGVTTV